jgi:hypothetical protein
MAEFLQVTSSQFTPTGIAALSEELEAGQLAVFFRNNHFSTLFKHPDGDLFILVTDEGYVEEEGLMWERVDDAKGNSTFFTPDFTIYAARRTQDQVLNTIQPACNTKSVFEKPILDKPDGAISRTACVRLCCTQRK